ncbi:MAG: FxsA family protein [Helicobacter sp.]|nr:FxsA family protein [Helicobacter sp.]
MPLIFGLIYLILEVFVSFEAIRILGVLGFVLEIILSAFVGIFMLVNFRFFLGDALSRLRGGSLSYEGFVGSNLFRILGAILLIMPGAFTDLLGILMQFSILGFWLFKPFIKSDNFVYKDKKNKQFMSYKDSDIIDVEFEVKKDSNG